MHIELLSPNKLTNLDQLEKLLIDRIPNQYRDGFFKPTHPIDITNSEFGLEESTITKAINLIKQAMDNNWQVVVYGDYDCDGITATAVMYLGLKRLGIKVNPFIPHRTKHGYGLSLVALKEIISQQRPDLVITVDNGIVAHQEIEWLKQQGIKAIVTDHHMPDEEQSSPLADAVVHSTLISGVGVAWVLIRELFRSQQTEKNQDSSLFDGDQTAIQLLDLVVLGIIADQIPLYGPARSLAIYGLLALRESSRPGLNALAEAAQINLRLANTSTINYALAPRLNAMGRLETAGKSLDLLLTDDLKSARELVKTLQQTNLKRQEITNQAWQAVDDFILTKPEDSIVVAAGPYHEGIIGLVASKLVDKYHKPAIVLSTSESQPKASARSIKGVHISNLLRSLPKELFVSLGGHKLAAGFSLAEGRLQDFLEKIVQLTNKQIDKKLIEPKIQVLGELDWNLINLATVKVIDKFRPFGAGNQEPMLAIRGKLQNSRIIGRDKTHLKLNLAASDRPTQLSAVCFQYQHKLPDDESAWEEVDLWAVRLKRSTYRSGLVDVVVQAGSIGLD